MQSMVKSHPNRIMEIMNPVAVIGACPRTMRSMLAEGGTSAAGGGGGTTGCSTVIGGVISDGADS